MLEQLRLVAVSPVVDVVVERPASDKDLAGGGETAPRSSKRDPEWDTDYGWGGGRFGKRREEELPQL